MLVLCEIVLFLAVSVVRVAVHGRFMGGLSLSSSPSSVLKWFLLTQTQQTQHAVVNTCSQYNRSDNCCFSGGAQPWLKETKFVATHCTAALFLGIFWFSLYYFIQMMDDVTTTTTVPTSFDLSLIKQVAENLTATSRPWQCCATIILAALLSGSAGFQITIAR